MKYIIIAVLALLPLTASAAFDSSLSYGAKGNSVYELQEFLVSEECLSAQPTGYFGFLTLKGVKCFQAKYGIEPVSGYFGKLSRAKANEISDKELEVSKVEEKKETIVVGSVPMPEPTVTVTPVPSEPVTPPVIQITPEPVKNTKVLLTNVSWSPVGEPYGYLTIQFRELDEQGNTVSVPNATIKIYSTNDNSKVFEMDSITGKDSRIRCNTTEQIEFQISYPPNTLCTYDYAAPFHDKEGAYIIEVTNGKSVDRRSFIIYEPSL